MLLFVIDVRPLAFGEPVYKECLGSAPEEDDGPVAFRSSLPWPGNPLFDDLTAKVGVDLALFGPCNRLTQGRIRNPFLPGEALKLSGFEDSHECAWINFIALGAIVQGLPPWSLFLARFWVYAIAKESEVQLAAESSHVKTR